MGGLETGGLLVTAKDPNTPLPILMLLASYPSALLAKTAINNPSYPFRLQFLNYLILDYVEGCKISETPCAVERREEFEEMVTGFGLTIEEFDSMPYAWVVALLKGK